MPYDTDKRRLSFTQQHRRKRVLLPVICFILIASIVLLFRHSSRLECREASTEIRNGTLLTSTLPQQHRLQDVTFHNLNTLDGNNQVVVMVVLPPWAVTGGGASLLETFFKQLAQQTHDHTRVAVLILNPPSPATPYTVRHHLSVLPFAVDIYTKTYTSMKPWITEDDHSDNHHQGIYELEPLRKSAMARAKNFLLQSALEPQDSYVLWLDPSLDHFPATMIEDFIAQTTASKADDKINVDILVPNTMVKKGDGTESGYERSNWQETAMSKSLQDTVPEDFVFMEGWWEYDTHRFLMVDMLTDGDKSTLGLQQEEQEQALEFIKVPLDGVGSTCLFVKAEVHRSGFNFPPYPYQHQLDSEAFAKAAQLEGFTIMGLPNYKVYHSNKGGIVDDSRDIYDDNDDGNEDREDNDRQDDGDYGNDESG